MLGSRLATEPSKSIALARVRDGKASLVIIDREAPSEDVAPHLHVDADPERTLQLLVRALWSIAPEGEPSAFASVPALAGHNLI